MDAGHVGVGRRNATADRTRNHRQQSDVGTALSSLGWNCRTDTRNSFLKKQFRGTRQWLTLEASLHSSFEQAIVQSDHRHALVVSHVIEHDRMAFTPGGTRSGV